MAYKKVEYIIHVVDGRRFTSQVDATFWDKPFYPPYESQTLFLQTLHWQCWVHNPYGMSLCQWELFSTDAAVLTIKQRDTNQSHTEKMHNITYTWNKSCLLFYISIGKYCYKSSKQSTIYIWSVVFTLLHLIVCNQTEQLNEIKLSIGSYQLAQDPY